MKPVLDRFVLGIPLLFIKQYPYAWIALVALWAWPPVFSWIFLLIVLSGMLMMKWQSSAWISNLRREHAFKDGKFHVDAPGVQPIESARKILLLMAGGGLIAWILNGRFGLNFWQIFLLIVGFTLLYQDTRYFGAPTIYIVTNQGIGIRFVPGHLDYRLFLHFKEISRIERREYQKDRGWDLFARRRNVRDGLLLIPKNPNGFSKRTDKIFIAPDNLDEFMEQLPQGYGSVH